MQNNYYALAHEQAANERTEVSAQLAMLLARDAKLEKLMSALREVLSAGEAAAPAEAQEAEHHEEAHWPEHPNHGQEGNHDQEGAAS